MDIKNMTLEQKIGQMIVAGFPSKMYDEHLDKLINHNIGNVILFARNVGSKEDIAKLNSKIQEKSLEKSGIPAFITIDQEGGMVTRIFEGAAFLPGNMALGAAGDSLKAFRAGEISGEELRALGINFNLAPVLDVNNNPNNPVIGVRSYSDNPKAAAEFGVNMAKGLQSKGVIATAKHFPGHGDTDVDSHLDLPTVNHSMERLEEVELYPFKKAINSGIDAIMSAHVLFPAIEEEKLPGTLSYKVLTGLLRKKLGFKGLIMTDCMEMNAIKEYFGTAKAAVMAVKAGADLICISHTLEAQLESFENIKKAVLSGELKESRIDESVERILKAKEKYNLYDNAFPHMSKVKSLVGCREHVEFAEKLSEKSITVVWDRESLVPVKTQNLLSISTEPVILTGADDAIKKKTLLSEALKEALGGDAFTMSLSPSDEEIKGLVDLAKDKDLVIIGTYNAALNKGQIKLVEEILKVNKNVIAIALRIPYDISRLKDVPCAVCSYEYTPVSVKSIIKVITGKIKPEGKLPVKL